MNDHGTSRLPSRGIDRRSFLKYSAVVGATASAAGALGATGVARAEVGTPGGPRVGARRIVPMDRGDDRGHASRDGIGRCDRAVDHARPPRSDRGDGLGGPAGELDHRGEPGRRGDRHRARSRACCGPRARAVAWHPDRPEGRDRHGGPHGYDRRLACPGRLEGSAGRRRGDPAPGGRGHPAGQGEHVRVECVPRVAHPRRLERARRRGTEPVCVELQYGRLQLWIGGGRRCELRRRSGGSGDLWIDRDAVIALRGGRA